MIVLGNIREQISQEYDRLSSLNLKTLQMNQEIEKSAGILLPFVTDDNHFIKSWFNRISNNPTLAWHLDWSNNEINNVGRLGPNYSHFISCAWPNPTQFAINVTKNQLDSFISNPYQRETKFEYVTPNLGDVVLVDAEVDVHRTNPKSNYSNQKHLLLRIFLSC